jgi:hypothetical protein
VGHDSVDIHSHEFLFHGDGGDDMAISAATVMRDLWQARVQLQDFQAGDWGEARKSDLIQLPGQWKRCEHAALLAHGKIYLICMAQYILGIDVQSLSLFSIKLPNGVEFEYDANIALSRAEGSGFCLVHVRRFQISAWRYTMDHSSTGNWELIDTIYLRQVFGPNADPTWSSRGADVRVAAVGDNADFVFLRIQKKVFYLHISSRTVEKVYELAQHESLFGISPFMMVWPPTFPTLNGGHDNDE